MLNSVRRVTPFALAFVLGVAGTAFAGDNADVTFSTASDTEVTGIGAGGTVSLSIAAAGMVGVKQFDVTVEFSPADAFDVSATKYSAPSDFIAPGQEVDGATLKIGAANFGGDISGDGSLGDFTFTASESFMSNTEASITVTAISLGPNSTSRDEFAQETIGIAITVNPPAPPVTEPKLVATTATDVSLDLSGIGDGDVADGSDGEVTFSLSFSNSEGAGSAQEITWNVTNHGAESVFLLGEPTEIAAGTEASISGITDADGSASATFDAEGDKSAGSTSISVTVSTSADNSEGVNRDLSVEYSATWDVPVPAELASFAAQITADRDVLLRWGVASQTNNLGWEVFRSTDKKVYERVSGLIDGAGTIDVYTSYEFVDDSPPKADALFYYLRQIDLDGGASRSEVIEVLVSPTVIENRVLPTSNALSQNFPNPFNPETTITFDLAHESPVTLTIYDVTGQIVRTLIQGTVMGPGNYQQIWNGTNRNGMKVSSGVYFYELRAGHYNAMKKMSFVQ